MSTNPVRLAIIGYGDWASASGYAEYALSEPSRCKVVAIAGPRTQTQALFADRFGVDRNRVFETWEQFYKTSAEMIQVGKRFVDAIIIIAHDHIRAELVVAFAAQGYDILCETPMATSVEHCLQIENAVKNTGIIFGLGFVFRYSSYVRAITAWVKSGTLGQLVNIQHIEPVGHWHFAHSFVRGIGSRQSECSFSLLTMSCPDIDIICHWFSPDPPVSVSSFGGLQHFRKSGKPAVAGDATRCLDCAYETQCPYSAKRFYLDRVAKGQTKWPVTSLVDGIPDIENVTEALVHGPYGRCVYESDNDVCDNQVVNIQYASGATASFTMVAYTALVCKRQTRLHFTHGEIVGDMDQFTVTDFRTGQSTVHRPAGGDGYPGLMKTFIEAVRTRRQDLLGIDVTDILKSHLTTFAAEHSRKTRTVVDCSEFEKDARCAWNGCA